MHSQSSAPSVEQPYDESANDQHDEDAEDPAEEQNDDESDTESAAEPAAEIPQACGNKQNRQQCKSKGGVAYNKPRAHNPGSWTASYRRVRRPFNTKAEAEA